MRMTARTRRIGGSLMVIIPKEMVEVEQLSEGQEVEIQVKKVKKKDFSECFGMFKGIGSWSRAEDRPHEKRDD